MLNPWQLDLVARSLEAGGVIAYPTESVYGLGCDPNNSAALQRILEIKQRSPDKGLIILVSDIRQAFDYLSPMTSADLDQVTSPQQRATTWLIKKSPDCPVLLSGKFASLAVRVTKHPIARQICEYTNRALVSTSCNRAGKSPMASATQVRNLMGGEVDYVVPGGCGGEAPSRIIDLQSGYQIRGDA